MENSGFLLMQCRSIVVVVVVVVAVVVVVVLCVCVCVYFSDFWGGGVGGRVLG